MNGGRIMNFIRFKTFISDLIRKDIFWIFTINLILLIHCLILHTPYNETNDDTGMVIVEDILFS